MSFFLANFFKDDNSVSNPDSFLLLFRNSFGKYVTFRSRGILSQKKSMFFTLPIAGVVYEK